jgi:CRISPR-associated protein Csd1
MILQALKEYYDRKAADPESGIAAEGFERKEIPFLVVINRDGEFVNLEDTREKVGNRMVAHAYMLPRSKTRTGSRSFETTFLLWDHIGYLFGQPEGDQKAAHQHHTWLQSLKDLPNSLVQDEGVKAIVRFYSMPGQTELVKAHDSWAECLKLVPCNMTFRLAGDEMPIACRATVQTFVQKTLLQQEVTEDSGHDVIAVHGVCLITGKSGEIARIHGRTPINKDTKSLVAFQKNSGYDSYRKEQCFNAPVCKAAEFAYTTGLNTLLKSKRQRIQVGDAATVFWSAKKSAFENDALLFFAEPRKDDPDWDTDAVRAVYASIWNGAYVVPEDDTKFYVLALSPNSARIAVRFWQVATVKEIGFRFKLHVDDLSIAHGTKTDSALPIRRLLHAIAPLEDDEKLPPSLCGDMVRSILAGSTYPQTLLQAAIRRIRAEHDVTYPRAALIKAYLNRSTRSITPKRKEELHVTLDPTNPNIGYRLGRLFATLERIQIRKFTQKGGKEPNSTIRDKYYGSASGTPVAVFGTLIRLSKHHLSDLENIGERINFEKLLCEIFSGIDSFPPHLPLEDQGYFAIGYYHQKQNFFTKKNDDDQPKGHDHEPPR